MENYVFIKCAFVLVICLYFIAFTYANISSAEARNLNRKLEYFNSDLQNKLSVALFEIQELRESSVKCECQHQTVTDRNLGEPGQSTTTERVKTEKESSITDIARLFKSIEHEKYARKKSEHYLRDEIKVHQAEIGQLKKQFIAINTTIDKLTEGAIDMNTTIDKLTEGAIDMNTTIDKLTEGAIDMNTTIDKLTEGAIDMNTTIDKLTEGAIDMNTTIDKLTEGAIYMKRTITSQHGKIHNLSTILETRKMAIPVCEIPSSIKYGTVDYSSGTMVGAMATYTCNDGFSVQGENKRTCLPSRQWKSDEPQCIPVCPTLSPLLHGHVEYTSTRVGSKATYSCDVGFARDGLTERICLPTAEWIGVSPVCVQVCTTPSSLLHGNVEYTSTRVGSKATYSCDVGFARAGLTERICLPTAEWEGETPVCVQVCSTPSPLLHGHVEYTSTLVGSKATYSCDVGFTIDGLTERMCLPTAEWKGETPVCVHVCPTPSPLLHGHVEYTSTRVGSKATYSCDVGFTRDGLKERICLPTAEWEGETPVCIQDPVHNCKDILVAGLSTGDGLYHITVNDNGKPVEKEVYCDMTTDNGGWTVFQYRYNGSVDFYRVYNEYTEGFGRYPGEFWLGLKWLHALTTRGQYMLRVDLTAKDPSGVGQVTGFAKYTNFRIGPAAGSYKLHVGRYLKNSTIGDQLTYHDGRGFSTRDHDVDISSGNCAVWRHGAWWYRQCAHSNLNGRYLEPGVYHTSMYWRRWPTGNTPLLVASQLSFKPV